ncbi:superoxide dismutase family protein [Pasteurellaceae bacterium HPA106]|uniref:superoxide dismutase family protein n=1 Tax=Spirabiliibacterium pneumoniae TaxID=221400 RepID=UPI001AACE191|nr:superoxide dismutase family protein [Spirabiliibacterium pneumoniae]MBE2896935.1 superoxide dismutase family protein [Spirabiliibacterium pneumoniae]
MKKSLLSALTLTALLSATSAIAHGDHNHDHSKALEIPMQLLDVEKGNQDIGKVYISESKYGLVFTPELHDLTPGIHGFHIHQNPSCEAKEKEGKLVAGLGAGGHWDPKNTGKHSTPWDDDGHLGDLPALAVDQEGHATNPVLAPRLHALDEIKGHALMIHAHGDNHSDEPKPLGGGGARMACGVIK